MSIEQKRKTVRNIFLKYTGFSKREADRVCHEADVESIEAIANADPEDAKRAVQQAFDEIRIKEGQAIQNQQIKQPSPVLDASDDATSVVVVDDAVAGDEGSSPVAGLDADE